MRKNILSLAFLFLSLYANAQVSVTATAGIPGPTSYATVNAAFAAINSATHQGDITISITGNTSEPSTPTALLSSGNGPAYTSILMKPVGGDWTVNSVNQTDNTVMIDLAGSDNVTVDGDPLNTGSQHLSFVVSTAAAGTRTAVFRLSSFTSASDGAQNNIIKNCIITGSRFSVTDATATHGIYMAGTYSAISIANLSAYDCVSNRFEKNIITKCLQGINVSGSAGFPANGLVIKNNVVGSSVNANCIGTIGITLTNTAIASGNNAIVEGNEVMVGPGDPNLTPYLGNVSLRGISLAQGNLGCIVKNNYVHAIHNPDIPSNTTGGQAFAIGITVATNNNNISIQNNMIRDVVTSRFVRTSTTQGATGIMINAAVSGIAVDYNTIVLDQTSTNGGTLHYFSACLNFANATAMMTEMKNNIMINKQGTDSSYVLKAVTANLASVSMDYNDYFSTGSKFALYNNADVSYAGWNAASGKDASSLNINPVFVSSTDLHLSPSSSVLNGQGIVIAGISTDFDGDTRSSGVRPNGPDIGADEYIPGCSSASGGTASASPAGPFCGSGTSTVSSTGYSSPGTGITYLWQSSTDPVFTTPVDIGSPSSVYSNLNTGAITSTTYYRLKVVCATASLTAYSNVVTLTVTVPPAATIAYTASPYCVSGGTATVSLTGTGGGAFSASPAGLTLNSSNGDITLGTSAPGTYTVTYTISAAGGCNLFSTSTSVTVNPMPNAGTVNGITPLCSGSTSTYTSDGDAGGTWSSSNTLVATVNPVSGLVSAAGAGVTNIIYSITALGCTSTAQKSLTVNANPNAGVVNGTSPLCVGTSSTYTSNGDAGGTWSSSNTLTATVNAASGLVSALAPGSANIIYTITTMGCTSSAQKFLTVNPNPNAGTVTGTSPICVGSTATYSSNGDAGGTWSSSNPAVASVNLSSGLVSALSGGTTQIIYTVTNLGCSSSALASLSVTPLPSATISYTGSPYCLGAGTATVTQTGTPGGTYSATPAGLSINVSDGSISLATSIAGTYTVTYTIAASGGCTVYSTSTSVTLSSSPSATIAYTGSPYCTNGGTATVTRTGSAGGTYSASPSGLNLNAATGTVTLISSTPGTYTVTYNIPASGGCSAFNTTTSITINATPNAGTVSGTSLLCTGSTATYTTNGTPGGTWSSSNTGVATVNPVSGLVTGVSGGTANIIYSITLSGCTSSAQSSVIVNNAPSATIVYNGSPYCSSSGSATVTQTGTTGGTYSASPSGLSINSSTGTVTLGTSTPGTYTVTYTIAASGGCPVYTVNTPITVSAAPAATISYTGSPYCTNSGTATVSLTGTTGGTYSASPAGLNMNTATGAVTLGSSLPGIYTVTYTIAASGGCAVFNATALITVTAAPSASIVYTGSPYCSNSGVASVTQTGTSGGTYGASPSGLSINSSTGAINPGTSTPGSYTVTYTVAASGGCALFSTSASVIVTAAPSATINYPGSPYCTNSGIAGVTQTGNAGGTYTASPAGLSINNTTGAINPGSSSPGTYTVMYSVPASGGCALYSTTTSVTITAAPSASIVYTGTPYCINSGTATVSRTGTGGGTFSASPVGLSINSSTGTVTLASSTPGTYTVSYTVAAAGGCAFFIATTTITVNPLPVPGSISGPSQLRTGATTTYTSNGNPGGVWTSSDPSVATIDAAGTLTAKSIGICQVIYTASTAGCTPLPTQFDLTVFGATLTNLYPNPVNRILNIIIESPSIDYATIQVFDMEGRQVFNQSGNVRQGLNNRWIDVSRLAGGTYNLKITNSAGKLMFISRLVKQ